MAENKWGFLGLFHPTCGGPITPLTTGQDAHLVATSALVVDGDFFLLLGKGVLGG